MAVALARGLTDTFELEFVARTPQKLTPLHEEFGAPISPLEGFNIQDKNLILAVKPHALEDVGKKLTGQAHTVYSLLAGTTLASLKAHIPTQYTIRTMPNVSAKFGASTTVITGDLARKDHALEIFSRIGDTFWVEREKELDIATAIAGSGPALLTLVAEAMMDGLVKEGMKRVDAIAITNSLFKGFAPLLASDHPAIIKDSIMSPAGTTAAAYGALEAGAVRWSFMQAVGEAFKVTQR